MNPRQFLPALAALVLAGCDNSSNAQEGTSSETQTVLQALADNVRRTPTLGGTSTTVALAARTLRATANCAGAEVQWIQNGYWQQELLPPVDTSSDTEGNRWLSRRVGLATDRNGRRKGCGEGGYFQVRWHQDLLERTGVHVVGDGIASGEDQIKGIDRFAYALTSTSLSGFRFTVHAVDTAFFPSEWWFNWSHADVLESYLTFGDGRYRIPGIPGDRDTSRLPGFHCYHIQDLKVGAQSIGSYCVRSLPQDSVVILDASGKQIVPDRTKSWPIIDSMGLSLLSATIDAERLKLSFRVQTPTAPEFSSPLTRICLGCSASGSPQRIPFYLDVPTGQAEVGSHFEWAVPLRSVDPQNSTISLLRRYPDWLHQMANSEDSMSGWWIASRTNLKIPDKR